ncbi:hypothetical protein L596_013615 [Steinernema carpocapsae]|uniref:Protein kinase domain-containing protein n=1 Tax=Steinernema carpocapsae TaxID=34508 RepID=A0A4U5P1J3_STECR|nr:hypothetical protein L596_013615 [Steinernema carpocapsae]
METPEKGSSKAHLDDLFYSHYLTPSNAIKLPKRYIELRLISSSARGMSFSAQDTVTKKAVALKCLNSLQTADQGKHTFREIRLLLRASHPNIVKLVSVFSPSLCLGDPQIDVVYIVLEKMDSSLTHAINMARIGKHKMTHKHISFLLYQILCGVKYLHDSGIVHRDLTPDNIGVNEKGCCVKLFGFGLSRKKPDSLQMSPYVATRFYRAPEIILDMEYDARVDMWSIGCILAEMILKRVLFPGQNYFLQWIAIVQVLGRPKMSFYERLKGKARDYAMNTGPDSRRTWDQIFPDQFSYPEDQEPVTLPNAKNFISRVLNIDPSDRITVRDALQHSYVNCWHDNSEVNVTPIQGYDDGEMIRKDVSLEEWKDQITSELKKFHEKHDVFEA